MGPASAVEPRLVTSASDVTLSPFTLHPSPFTSYPITETVLTMSSM
jgi:hypothetical protein